MSLGRLDRWKFAKLFKAFVFQELNYLDFLNVPDDDFFFNNL